MQPQEYDTLRTLEDRHWWYHILRSLVSRELAGRLPPHARILDAGCGTGGMMAALLQQHPQWVVEGIDTNMDAIRHCQARGLDEVQQGNVGNLPFATGSFDAVLSLDVLYHADVDETRAFAEMVRVLKPGGVLILNLPAFDCLRGSHDAAVCGARRYRACHVHQRLENHTLSIEMIRYWNAWLFLPLLLRRWWSRSFLSADLSTIPSDLTLPSLWLNALLTALGKADVWLCRTLRLPWGSSVFAIATQPFMGLKEPAHVAE